MGVDVWVCGCAGVRVCGCVDVRARVCTRWKVGRSTLALWHNRFGKEKEKENEKEGEGEGEGEKRQFFTVLLVASAIIKRTVRYLDRAFECHACTSV